MADETNKPLDAGELSADDLQKVAGGSTPTNTPEITVIDTLPTPTQENKGNISRGWDIPEKSAT